MVALAMMPDLWAVKIFAIAAIASVALALAYSKGSENARAEHRAYIEAARRASADAQYRWDRQRASLEADVKAARDAAQAESASSIAADNDAAQRVNDVVKSSNVGPMGAELAARVNAIVRASQP